MHTDYNPTGNNSSDPSLNLNNTKASTQTRTSRFKVIEPDNITLDNLNNSGLPLERVIIVSLHIPFIYLPCGHTSTQKKLLKSMFETQEKKCPVCAKVYTFAVENLFAKQFGDAFKVNLFQAHPGSSAIQDEIKKLPSPEKAEIEKALDSILKSGNISEAMSILSRMIITSSDHRTLMPLYTLLVEYSKYYDKVLHALNKTPTPSLPNQTQQQKQPTQASTNIPATSSRTSLPQSNAIVRPTSNTRSITAMIPTTSSSTPYQASPLRPHLSPASTAILPSRITYTTNGAPQSTPPPTNPVTTYSSAALSSTTTTNNFQGLQPPLTVNNTDQTSKSSNTGNSVAELTSWKKMKFLQVVKIADLICPLTKKFMIDPYQLVPCGHNFNKQGILEAFKQTRTKNCTHCSQPYTAIIQNLLVKSTVSSFLQALLTPGKDTAETIRQLHQSLPQAERENALLGKCLHDFLSGNISNTTDLSLYALNSPHSELLLPLLKLIEEHRTNAREDIDLYIKDTLESPLGSNVLQVSTESSMSTPTMPSSSSQSNRLEGESNSSASTETPSESPEASPIRLTSTQESNSIRKKHMIKFISKRPLSQPEYPPAKSARTSDLNTEVENPEQQNTTLNAQEQSTDASFNTSSATTAAPPSPDLYDDEPANAYIGNNVVEPMQPEEEAMETDVVEAADMTLINKLKKAHRSDYSSLVNAFSLKAVDENGNTPLHLMVIKFTWLASIFYKIENYDIDYNAQNEMGQTPLHIAAEMNKPKIIAFLLNHGASPDILDNEGRRPQDLATEEKAIEAFES